MSKAKAKDQPIKEPGRRNFLRTAVVATGATTVAAAAVAHNGDHSGGHSNVLQPKQAKGYRETAHVREYYRLARF